MTVAKDQAIADLAAALKEATEKLEKQDAQLKAMMEPPNSLAVITHVIPEPDDEGRHLIVVNNDLVVEHPKHMAKEKFEAGEMILVGKSLMGFNIIRKFKLPDRPRMTVKVAEIVNGKVYLEGGPGNLIPIHKCTIPCEVGDRLLLGGVSAEFAEALENLGKETKAFQFNDELNVSWNDIGGQKAAKEAMREAIEYPILHANLYKSLGKRPIKGVLLEGPPGCGKTLLAKAAAGAISRLHGASAKASGYIYVKGPEVLSKWVGEAEATIRSLFAMAREHKAKHNYPAILFIDECEAILSKRGMGVSSDMEKTIVPSFLAELDGLNDSGAMVILATNRGERLDPAVVRDGRIDRRIRVNRPEQRDAKEIFAIHLGKVPTCRQVMECASEASEMLFSGDYALHHVKTTDGHTYAFNLGHAASGAMIAGIVDRATSVALYEAIEKEQKSITLNINHVKAAIEQTHVSMRSVDHTDDIKTLAEDANTKVASIQRA